MTEKQQRLIGAYVGSIYQLERLVWDLTEDQVSARPVPGKWSTLELVAHLADFEPLFADRMKRVIAGDAASLIPGDEDKFASSLFYQKRNFSQELALIRGIRLQMAGILTKLAPEEWQKTGVHEVKGVISLENLLEGINYHIPHHIPFLVAKREALGLPRQFPGMDSFLPTGMGQG